MYNFYLIDFNQLDKWTNICINFVIADCPFYLQLYSMADFCLFTGSVKKQCSMFPDVSISVTIAAGASLYWIDDRWYNKHSCIFITIIQFEISFRIFQLSKDSIIRSGHHWFADGSRDLSTFNCEVRDKMYQNLPS